MSRRSFLMKMGAGVAAARVAGFGAAMSGAGSVRAQSRKPITLMVGFPPGGGPDLVARAVAEPARRDLGQAMVIENRTGAGGRIALDWLRNAQADGSNFALTPASMLTAYPHVYKRLPYSLAEFAPVCKLCIYHLSVVAPADAPYSTLQEFVAWARSTKEATFGVPGLGNATEFVGRLLAQAENLSLEPISYRGGPQLTQAVVAGEVSLAVNLSSNFIELVKAGRLKVLAVTSAVRSPFSRTCPRWRSWATRISCSRNLSASSPARGRPSRTSPGCKTPCGRRFRTRPCATRWPGRNTCLTSSRRSCWAPS